MKFGSKPTQSSVATCAFAIRYLLTHPTSCSFTLLVALLMFKTPLQILLCYRGERARSLAIPCVFLLKCVWCVILFSLLHVHCILFVVDIGVLPCHHAKKGKTLCAN